MVYNPVGIRSLALSMPGIKRTNDYYRQRSFISHCSSVLSSAVRP